jgi:Ca2+/Na+ antiporter
VCISDKSRFGLLPIVQLLLVLVSLFYAIARPCKEYSANIIQSILLALTAFILQLAYFATVHVEVYFTLLVLLLCLLAPHIGLYGYAAYKIIKQIHRKFCYCSISRPNGDNQVDVQHERDGDGGQSDECTLLLKK